MDVFQYFSITNFLAKVWPSALDSGRIEISETDFASDLIYGHNLVTPFNYNPTQKSKPESTESKPKDDVDELSVEMSDAVLAGSEPACPLGGQLDIKETFVFKDNFRFYGYNGITGLDSHAMRQDISIFKTKIKWCGTVNTFHKLCESNNHSRKPPLDHISDNHNLDEHFANGISINLGSIIDVSAFHGFSTDDIKWQWYKGETGTNFSTNWCYCGADKPPLKPEALNFDGVYVHGISILKNQTKSTFPFKVGIKTNCANFKEPMPDKQNTFYSNYIYVHDPLKPTHLPTTTTATTTTTTTTTTPTGATTSTESIDRNHHSVRLTEPHHSMDWVGVYGGLRGIFNGIVPFQHLPAPFVNGIFQIPSNVVFPNGIPSHPELVKVYNNPILVVPRDHIVFNFFAELYRKTTDPSLDRLTRRDRTLGRDLSKCFFQFISLPIKSATARYTSEDLNNSMDITPDIVSSSDKPPEQTPANAAFMKIVTAASTVDMFQRSKGHCLIISQESIQMVYKWIYIDNQGHLFKRPIKLSDIALSLFRVDNSQASWLVESDMFEQTVVKGKKGKSKLKKTLNRKFDPNAEFSFETEAWIIFSVFPSDCNCNNQYVATPTNAVDRYPDPELNQG